MKKNSTFASLSIAAIAFFAAAVPCVAQSTSSETRADSTSVATARHGGVTLALNNLAATAPSVRVREASVNPTTAGESTVAKNAPKMLRLSPSAFKASDEFTTGNKLHFKTQLTYESDKLDSKQQFRVDEEAPKPGSSVTFVPSRGPRIPN